MGDTVSVVIPAHPARERNGMLTRALASVEAQTLQPDDVIVQVDTHREGAARTRQRGLERASTDWVTFLDSDDEMLPHHLEALLACAQQTGADLVYPWYEVVGGGDPMPCHFGKPWDPARPRLTTVVTLCRTELAQQVGFVHTHDGTRLLGQPAGEDWFFIVGCNKAGAHIVHLPQRTWRWHHHGRNSSGQPTKGDAR